MLRDEIEALNQKISQLSLQLSSGRGNELIIINIIYDPYFTSVVIMNGVVKTEAFVLGGGHSGIMILINVHIFR